MCVHVGQQVLHRVWAGLTLGDTGQGTPCAGVKPPRALIPRDGNARAKERTGKP